MVTLPLFPRPQFNGALPANRSDASPMLAVPRRCVLGLNLPTERSARPTIVPQRRCVAPCSMLTPRDRVRQRSPAAPIPHVDAELDCKPPVHTPTPRRPRAVLLDEVLHDRAGDVGVASRRLVEVPAGMKGLPLAVEARPLRPLAVGGACWAVGAPDPNTKDLILGYVWVPICKIHTNRPTSYL